MRNVSKRNVRSSDDSMTDPLSRSAVKASMVRVNASVSASSVNEPAGDVSKSVDEPTAMVTGMGLLPEPPKRPGLVCVPPGLAVSS